MIGKAGTGGDFRGLARYLLRGRESESERVGWTVVRNMPVDAEHAASLMSDTAAQNVRVQKPVYHLSLSAAPGEELSREEWGKVVDRVLRRVFVREDVPRARRELVRQAREVGWREAGRRLADNPRKFGRVRGIGLGPVRNDERDVAVRAAWRVGKFAARFAAVRSARLSLGREGARAVVQAVRAARAIRGAEAALRRLPARRGLELEMAKKALALGVSLAELALKPNALQVVKTALRTAELVRSAARGDREMEMER